MVKGDSITYIALIHIAKVTSIGVSYMLSASSPTPPQDNNSQNRWTKQHLFQ